MQSVSFNDNWNFMKEGAQPVAVTLPHDAMQTEPRTADAPSGGGGAYYLGGKYAYEKKFTPEEPGVYTLSFDGVYRRSTVLLNGEKVGGAAYGYLPFLVPLDGLKIGEENTVRVEVDNSAQPNSRWYAGSGIYRPVTLLCGKAGGFAPRGLRVSTVSTSPAKVRIEAQTGTPGAEITLEIYDGETLAASGTTDTGTLELEIPEAKLWSAETPHLYTLRASMETPDGTDTAETVFGVRQITWDNRGFYVNGESVLLRGGCIHHDNGILGAASPAEADWRRVRRMKEMGFNAIRSAHNPISENILRAADALGMYIMDETWDMWYKRKTAHDYGEDFEANYRADLEAIVARDFNHPSVAMYSIGNEVTEPASPRGIDLAYELIEVLHALDGTRPVTGGINLSILMASAGGKETFNPDAAPGTPEAAMLEAAEDAETAETPEVQPKKKEKQGGLSGMNSTMFNLITSVIGTNMNKAANGKKADQVTTPVLDALDIAGYNYASGRYPLEAKAHPNRLILGSETFPQDIAKNWAMVEKFPYLVGDFMWTAWDYLGETGIGAWSTAPDAKGFSKPYPWLLADTGAIDILGDPNAEMFWANAAWGQLKNPAVTVQPPVRPGEKLAGAVWRGTNGIPVWSWKGCAGIPVVVEVFSQDPTVELFLNGASYGKKAVKECRAVFKLPYAPGILRAVSYDAHRVPTSETVLRSAMGRLSVRAEAETETVAPNGVAYVSVSIVGENGELEGAADTKLSVEVENGTLLAFGSANPRTEERFEDGAYTTYHGRAQAIVRAGESGTVTLRVKGEGLAEAKAEIAVQ